MTLRQGRADSGAVALRQGRADSGAVAMRGLKSLYIALDIAGPIPATRFQLLVKTKTCCCFHVVIVSLIRKRSDVLCQNTIQHMLLILPLF